MKIEKVSDYDGNAYPTLEQMVENDANRLIKKGGTALLAASILAGTMTMSGCKTSTAGSLIYSEPDSSQETSVAFMGDLNVLDPSASTSCVASISSQNDDASGTTFGSSRLTSVGTYRVTEPKTTTTRFAGMPLLPTEEITTTTTFTAKTSTTTTSSTTSTSTSQEVTDTDETASQSKTTTAKD